MTQYELLKANQSLLHILSRNNIIAKDVTMLQLVDDADKMEKDGEKKHYIVNHLADKYGVSVRSVYSLLQRMKEPVLL